MDTLLLFSKSFALRAYDYFDLDPIVLIGKYLFISVGMTMLHGDMLLIYSD